MDINRGTFYFHYTDMYDLLHQTEDDFYEQFENILNRNITQTADDVTYLTEIFSFIKDNSDMTKMLLGKNTDIDYIVRLKLLLQKYSEAYRNQHLFENNDSEPSLYSAFVLAGCVGIIKQWLDDGFKKSPEEVAGLAGPLIEAGLKAG